MHGINQEKPELVLHDEVVPLRQAHIWKAAGTWTEAFRNDPQLRYQRDDENQTRWTLAIDKIAIASIMSLLVKSNVALTIQSGAAFIIAAPALGGANPNRPIDRAIRAIINALVAVLTRKFGSAEQRKRNKEVEEKSKEVVNRVLGNRTKDMLNVILLATEPASQGYGYGGSLLDAVTSLADITGQASWLTSTNVRNTQFYNSHGFETVGEVVLGDQNPTWRRAPVLVKIMVREPQRVD